MKFFFFIVALAMLGMGPMAIIGLLLLLAVLMAD